MMDEDYIRTARAKGLGERRVIMQPRPTQRADPDRHPARPRLRPCCWRATRSSPRRSSTSPASAPGVHRDRPLRPAADPWASCRRLLRRPLQPDRRHPLRLPRSASEVRVSRCSRSPTCGSSSRPRRVLSTLSTASLSQSTKERRSGSSASRAPARASPTSRSSDSPAARTRGSGRGRCSRDRTCGPEDRAAASSPRRGDRNDLPGPAVVASPLLQGRRPNRRGGEGAPRRLQRRCQGAFDRSARAGRHPRRRSAGPTITRTRSPAVCGSG